MGFLESVYCSPRDDKNCCIIGGKRKKGSSIEEGIKKFVLKDSSWQDLAVEMAEDKVEVRLKGEGRQVKIKKAGVYEVYCGVGTLEREKVETLKVDGKEIRLDAGYQMPDAGRKYVKIGEVELGETSTNYESNTNVRIEKKRKEHTIQIRMQNSEIKDKEQNLKIVLVDKEERERLEKEIWEKINKPETELCYIFEKEKGEFWVE